MGNVNSIVRPHLDRNPSYNILEICLVYVGGACVIVVGHVFKAFLCAFYEELHFAAWGYYSHEIPPRPSGPIDRGYVFVDGDTDALGYVPEEKGVVVLPGGEVVEDGVVAGGGIILVHKEGDEFTIIEKVHVEEREEYKTEVGIEDVEDTRGYRMKVDVVLALCLTAVALSACVVFAARYLAATKMTSLEGIDGNLDLPKLAGVEIGPVDKGTYGILQRLERMEKTLKVRTDGSHIDPAAGGIEKRLERIEASISARWDSQREFDDVQK